MAVPTKITQYENDPFQVAAKSNVKSTILLITVNTNKRNATPEQTSVLQEAVEFFTEHIQEFMQLVEGAQYSKKYIESAKINWTVEVGSEKGLLHSHVLYQARHRTFLRLHLPRTRAFFQSRLAGITPNVYVNVRAVNAIDNLKFYLTKNSRNL